MPRPLRLEFIGAWYYIINRGKGRDKVFRSDKYRTDFLKILNEVSSVYRVRFHAYCLMDKEYHLLMSTPDANLSTALRHLNSVYTQYYNRISGTSGPLFNGRFKGVLLDEQKYAHLISRYIHLLPVKEGLVKKPEQFEWSSLQTYLGKDDKCDCLETADVLKKLQHSPAKYKKFIDEGLDEEISSFFSKRNLRSVLGDDDFEKISRKKLEQKKAGVKVKKPKKLSINSIAQKTAAHFNVDTHSLINTLRGRGGNNTPRAVTMLQCRMVGNATLREIADYFNIVDISTISATIKHIRTALTEDDDLNKKVKSLQNKLEKIST